MNGHFTNDIIASGIVPRLIELLDWKQNHSVSIKYEAIWILTNIVAGTTDQTRCVMQLNGHQKLIELIDHRSLNIRHTAIEALGNIAGDCSDFRDQLLEHGLLAHLLPFCSPVHCLKILRSVTWTLGGLCRTHPPPSAEHTNLILKGLSTLMFSEDDEILTNVCWAYCHLLRADDFGLDAVLNGSESTQNIVTKYIAKSKAERDHFQTAIDLFRRQINSNTITVSDYAPDPLPSSAGSLVNVQQDDPRPMTLKMKLSASESERIDIPTDVVGECYKMFALFSASRVESLHNDVLRQMIHLLEHRNATVSHSAIVAFGNMQRYMSEPRVVALHRDHRIMHTLHRLLHHEEVNVRRDCCWVISNIIVTLSARSELIVECKILPKVIAMVKADRYEVSVEALWAMANSVEKYYELVVEHGIIEAVFAFMARTRDKETFIFTMDILASIIHVTGGEFALSQDIGTKIAAVGAVECIMEWTQRHSSLIDEGLQQRIDTTIDRLHRYLAMFQ